MANQGRKAADDTLRMALACGMTVENAAHKAGVSVRTAYRRLRDPGFCRSLQETRADIVQRAAAMLTAAMQEAARTFIVLQHDATVPAGVRLAAARAVVECGVKLRDQADLEGRVAELEKCLARGPVPASPC